MIREAVLAALAVGWLLGGRLRHLAELRIVAAWWAVAALVAQYGLAEWAWRGAAWAVAVGPFAFTASLALLAAVALANAWLAPRAGQPWARWCFGAVGLGIALNLLAVASNGGQMPVSVAALRRAGVEERLITQLADPKVVTHQPLVRARLVWLTDVIPLPRPWPRPRAVSVGDLLLAGGTFALIVQGMRRAPGTAGSRWKRVADGAAGSL